MGIYIYPLVMTNIAMEAMALIEIDGLPFLIAWWIFPWRTVSHNQGVTIVNNHLVTIAMLYNYL